MKVWVVSESDYDNAWVVAAYSSRKMADDHVAEMGGYVDEVDVRETLHPDVTDPENVAARLAEAEKWRRRNTIYQERDAADHAARLACRPNPPHMSLCHCETFSPDTQLRNDCGYCGYCGGWAPKVFSEHMGVEALHREIDKLAEHDRVKMRALVSR